MALIDELSDDVLKNFGFLREANTLAGTGQVYWRGQSLRLAVQGKLMLLEGYNPVAVRAGHFLPLWTITFTQETPMPLVTAAIRRANDYMDVMGMKDPV